MGIYDIDRGVVLMDTKQGIDELARQHVLSYCGVADLTGVQDVIVDQGGEFVAGYPRCVSIGIALPHPIIDALPHREDAAVAVSYKHLYDITNLRLDLAAAAIASQLQMNGYRALPIPASKRYDSERICAAFSHKLGARLAGHGWVGKSCLLVTKEHGPRVRWASVLTDAPLEASQELLEERCGACTQCVDICPVTAYHDRNFRVGEPRELRYDARKCEDYFGQMRTDGKIDVCGLCVYVCPHGRKGK